MLNEDKVRNLWCYENQTDKQIAEQFNCSAICLDRKFEKYNNNKDLLTYKRIS